MNVLDIFIDELKKVAEYPKFRDPVNDRTQPEVSRGLEPTFRLTPRPKPVTAFKLPPT